MENRRILVADEVGLGKTIEAGHPILVIAAIDIVKILKENVGIHNVIQLNQWLINEFN